MILPKIPGVETVRSMIDCQPYSRHLYGAVEVIGAIGPHPGMGYKFFGALISSTTAYGAPIWGQCPYKLVDRFQKTKKGCKPKTNK